MAGDQSPQNRTHKPTIAGRLTETLRSRILDGSLEPGARLNLDGLRAEYSISLSSLREAITRLVSDGLIEVEEQRGYKIAPISRENLDEVTRLRIELEPLALRRAIQNGGLDWETNLMASLYRLNHTERDPANPNSALAWEMAHNAFHLALIARCDMPVLLKFCQLLMNMNDRYRRLFLRIYAEQRNLAEEHTAIAEAAAQRREDEAAGLLSVHIEKTSASLRERLLDALPEAQP